MPLRAASSIVIELVLLTDAVREKDIEESRRLARRFVRLARESGWSRVARQARTVELLAILEAPLHHVGDAADRLVIMAEKLIHTLPDSEQKLEMLTSVNEQQRAAQFRR
jgi:hypothetical protein